MDHKFQSSIGDAIKCARCKFPEHLHGDDAPCEACNTPADLRLFNTILLCPACIEKEKQYIIKELSPEAAEGRVEAHNDRMNATIQLARSTDEAIQIRTDLFNAATVAIVALKEAIDSDDSIPNKPYALAEELKKRFEHYKTVVFEYNEKIVDAGNQQKAIQVYLNNLANQLRVEEREKLKIADISYKPEKVKPVKPASIKTASKKLDKAELRKYAAELGIPEFTLQMIVVSKGLTVEAAANLLRKTINEAKSESTNETKINQE